MLNGKQLKGFQGPKKVLKIHFSAKPMEINFYILETFALKHNVYVL